jgi:hypothetical protein
MGGSFLKEESNRWGGHQKDTGRQECWCLFRTSSMQGKCVSLRPARISANTTQMRIIIVASDARQHRSCSGRSRFSRAAGAKGRDFVDRTSDPSYRGHLGEGTEGPRGEVRGGSSLEGTGKGRLWRKGSYKGDRSRRAAR